MSRSCQGGVSSLLWAMAGRAAIRGGAGGAGPKLPWGRLRWRVPAAD